MKCPKCDHEWNHFGKRQDRCTQEECSAFCASLGLPASDAEYLFNHWEGYAWRNSGQQIKDWKAVIRSWMAAGYLPSQRKPVEPKASAWRVILRKLYPDYGWIPTNFYDLPAEVKNRIKGEMQYHRKQ